MYSNMRRSYTGLETFQIELMIYPVASMIPDHIQCTSSDLPQRFQCLRDRNSMNKCRYHFSAFDYPIRKFHHKSQIQLAVLTLVGYHKQLAYLRGQVGNAYEDLFLLVLITTNRKFLESHLECSCAKLHRPCKDLLQYFQLDYEYHQGISCRSPLRFKFKIKLQCLDSDNNLHHKGSSDLTLLH